MRHTAWYHLDTARLGLCTTLATELEAASCSQPQHYCRGNASTLADSTRFVATIAAYKVSHLALRFSQTYSQIHRRTEHRIVWGHGRQL